MRVKVLIFIVAILAMLGLLWNKFPDIGNSGVAGIQNKVEAIAYLEEKYIDNPKVQEAVLNYAKLEWEFLEANDPVEANKKVVRAMFCLDNLKLKLEQLQPIVFFETSMIKKNAEQENKLTGTILSMAELKEPYCD